MRVMILIACACGSREPAPTVTATAPRAEIRNPVIDRDFSDPAILKARDGVYYAYASQARDPGYDRNIQVMSSTDLVHWKELPDALPAMPTWASRQKDTWAPSVIEAPSGDYFMYYNTRSDAGPGECLAVATSKSPAGPFVDSGAPLKCGDGYVNIDAMAFDDPKTGKHYLYWGSNHVPLIVQELAADRVHFAAGSRPIDLVRPGGPRPYEKLFEAPWVIFRDGMYYLFYSGDVCCEPKAHYAVLVARSRSATGPFETLADATGASSSVILEQNAEWLAPGHNAVLDDGAGNTWIVYAAIDRKQNVKAGNGFSRRPMLIDRLIFERGWPRVERSKSR